MLLTSCTRMATVLRMSVAALSIIAPARVTSAIVIDDFSVDPITVAGPSVQTQSGLDPAHVLGGSREFNVGQFGSGSVLSIDPPTGLTLQSSGRGYFDVKYNFAPTGQSVDLTQGGQDRIRLTFGDISTTFTPLGLSVNLPGSFSSNGISVYVQNWSGMILEFPYAKFPTSFAAAQNLLLDVYRNPIGASIGIRSITTAGPPLAGDYNRDGVVNSADYAVWRQFVGVNTRTNSIFPIASADGNLNGIVDAADYLIWRKHVGAGSASDANASGAVPEPAGMLLRLCAVVSLLCLRTRCRTTWQRL